MRYKQQVLDKLNKLTNNLNLIRHYVSTGESSLARETIETNKEIIEDIQTLLNNEIQE